jgi:hypothetical protein
MFVLRRITSESLEINTCLDIEYVLILKEKNKEEFKRVAKSLEWDNEETTKDVYGFVTFDSENNVMPLYQNSHYFIMGSDGKTFANITHK